MNFKKTYLFILAITFLLTFIVPIQAKAPEILVTLLNQDPDPVSQGDMVEVRFKIENNEAETLEDIEVMILPKYPFSLYTGNPTVKIGKLRASQTGSDSVIVDYKLKVDEKAIEGDNEIELQIKSGSYITSYTNDEFLVDIAEYASPDLKFYIRESTLLGPNKKGIITIEIANVDIADVKFLQMTLLPSGDYELLSQNNYVYLGDVDSDDTESEDFEIFIKELKENEIKIPIKVEYQDADENRFEKQIDLPLKVFNSDELNKYGLKEKSYTLHVILLIVALFIGYYYFKKRKKRK